MNVVIRFVLVILICAYCLRQVRTCNNIVFNIHHDNEITCFGKAFRNKFVVGINFEIRAANSLCIKTIYVANPFYVLTLVFGFVSLICNASISTRVEIAHSITRG